METSVTKTMPSTALCLLKVPNNKMQFGHCSNSTILDGICNQQNFAIEQPHQGILPGSSTLGKRHYGNTATVWPKYVRM